GFAKQRRCPAGIQQPASLIEPLNVKVKRHLRLQEKPRQDIDPNNALTLIDDTYNHKKPITSNSYLLKWAHLRETMRHKA
uniref:hypothetical protein n=1 Tax=Acinetobacter baumannii TaxID=470 RepID=UPI003C72D6A6